MFLTFALFTILFTVLAPALPSFGADGEGVGGHGVRSPHQGKDGFLKYLADRDFRSFLLFLGIPPQLVEGAVQLKTELTGLGMGIRRPDRLYRLGDGSLHSRVPIHRRRPGHLQVPRLLGDAGGGVQE
jgi:hypothetical protein